MTIVGTFTAGVFLTGAVGGTYAGLEVSFGAIFISKYPDSSDMLPLDCNSAVGLAGSFGAVMKFSRTVNY